MDGNLDREAMTADLESMKQAGIGYVLFLEVNVGVPRGKVDFLSDEWQELYKHAVREAERLGIRIISGIRSWMGRQRRTMGYSCPINDSPGCKRYNSNRSCRVQWEDLRCRENRKPFFGEGSLTPGLKKSRDEWYEDVVVLAFPSPETDDRIDDTDEKALYYRAPYTSQPGVLPYISAPASFKESTGSAIDQATIINLSDKLQKDGSLTGNIPPGKWTIMRFVKRNNGAVTRPAPEPGLGFEADKFDTASFDAHYNIIYRKADQKSSAPHQDKSGGGWTMIHIDSWEMGAQNWSPDFREEFRKRSGYDPFLFFLYIQAG